MAAKAFPDLIPNITLAEVIPGCVYVPKCNIITAIKRRYVEIAPSCDASSHTTSHTTSPETSTNSLPRLNDKEYSICWNIIRREIQTHIDEVRDILILIYTIDNAKKDPYISRVRKLLSIPHVLFAYLSSDDYYYEYGLFTFTYKVGNGYLVDIRDGEIEHVIPNLKSTYRQSNEDVFIGFFQFVLSICLRYNSLEKKDKHYFMEVLWSNNRINLHFTQYNHMLCTAQSLVKKLKRHDLFIMR
jgi:hypothetical protein